MQSLMLPQGDGKDAAASKEESGPYWSLMFEISESYCKPVNQKTIKLAGEEWPEIVKETIQGAINTKLTSADDQIVSIYHRSVTLPRLSFPLAYMGQKSLLLGRYLRWVPFH